MNNQMKSTIDQAGTVKGASIPTKSANDASTKQPYINWKGEPEEIKTKLPPVKLLDDDMLPEPLAPWLLDISYRMQVPVDFPAAAMFIVFGSVIGAGCRIRPKKNDDWSEISNLYGMVIGEPSMLKTPAVAEVLKLLDSLQFKYRDIYECEKTDHEFDAMIYEAEIKGLQKDIPKFIDAKDSDSILIAKDRYRELTEDYDPPKRRLFKINEMSVQSLTIVNKDNPRGILVHVDEIMGLLNQVDMPQNADMKAYLLSGWGGNGTYVDIKVGRGLTEVKGICLSLLGTTQPQKINAYVRGVKGRNDGSLQRYQMSVWPDAAKEWKNIDQKPNSEASNTAYKILDFLAAADFVELGAIQDRPESAPYFRFNDAGQAVFNQWLEKLMNVTLIYQDNPFMKQHLTKSKSTMLSIALIIHLIDLTDGTASNDGVSESAAKMAVRWCDYLASHARRIYSAAESSDHTAAILLSHKIKSNELPNPFKAHTVYRKGWHGLSDTEEAKAACKVLVEEGWLHEEVPPKPKTGRTPASEYYIHPSLIVDK